jgi:hypothetical protein
MSKDPTELMKEWIETRPPEIKALIVRFPPGTAITVNNQLLYVVGYAEGNGSNENSLIVSRTSPADDYDLAVATREYVCPDCVKRMDLH